jgi:hypothetical protein
MTVDLSAIAKWPNVPACYDWLSLDRRGDWRLQGERVFHQGFVALLNRQYGVDDRACWFVQNGPQRVFVSLAYTPWVFRRDGDTLISHTGQPAGAVQAVFLDEDGSILLETELGIGLLDDRELAHFLSQCRDHQENAVSDQAFLDLLQGIATPINWQGIALQSITSADLPERYRFNPQPRP